jgi:hypothetical protein
MRELIKLFLGLLQSSCNPIQLVWSFTMDEFALFVKKTFAQGLGF